MPHFTVQIPEEALDTEVERGLIKALTDTIGAVFGARARALVPVVELVGIPARRWGVGGEPATGGAPAPVVTLGLRERALSLPDLPDAPARLIKAITDAVAGVLGESVRAGTTVVLAGVPAGRSGVGGEVV
jgi:phenylpyruvate tautomerase PptA (4-oxalocrotonate tautomerase family)